MNTTNRNAAPSTNPANRRAPREFNLGRDHSVGQFLNAHSDAKRVMLGYRKGQEGMFSIGNNASYK